jgi:uncharacterized phage protein (TIGR01671 family)
MYRIWDKENKKMYYSGGNVLLSMDEGLKWRTSFYDNSMVGRTDGTLDQFETLLCANRKDKNGANLFEGDIIKWIHITREYNYECDDMWDEKEVEEVCEILWKDGCFYINAEIEYPMTCISDGQYEIVGNIYENPELLSPCANNGKH